jgi:hypothetical protein
MRALHVTPLGTSRALSGNLVGGIKGILPLTLTNPTLCTMACLSGTYNVLRDLVKCSMPPGGPFVIDIPYEVGEIRMQGTYMTIVYHFTSGKPH